MSLMVKSLCIMNFKGESKSHGSNAHEIWTRGSTFDGGPFLSYVTDQMRELVGPIKGGVSINKLRVVMALEPTTPR